MHLVIFDFNFRQYMRMTNSRKMANSQKSQKILRLQDILIKLAESVYCQVFSSKMYFY